MTRLSAAWVLAVAALAAPPPALALDWQPKAYGVAAGWPAGPGQVTPTLQPLGLANATATAGSAYSSAINGCIPGDTLSMAVTVMGKYSLSSASCPASLLGSGLTAGTDAPSITEALSGAANSPLTTGFSISVSAVAGQRLIYEDDQLENDIDGEEALGMAIAQHKAGAITLLAMVNDNLLSTSTSAVDTILHAYGVTNVPVFKNSTGNGKSGETGASGLAAALCNKFGGPGYGISCSTDSAYTDSVTGLKNILAAQPNASVAYVCTAGCSALGALMRDPAGGPLVASKLTALYHMAGNYPSTTGEANLGEDGPAEVYISNNITVPVYWIGNGYSKPAGPSLLANPDTDPLKYVFNVYSSGSLTTYANAQPLKRGWDQVAMAMAIPGGFAHFATLPAAGQAGGTNTITNTSGSVWGNSWSATPAGEHVYMNSVGGNGTANDRAVFESANSLQHSIEIGGVTQANLTSWLLDLREGSGATVADTTNTGFKGYRGTSQDGSKTDAPAWATTTGGTGNALAFSGAQALVIPQPTSGSPAFESTNFSFGLVVNLSSLPASGELAANNFTIPNGDTGFNLTVTSSGQLKLYFSAGNFVNGTSSLTAGTWAMVTFSISGSNVTMHVNGLAAGSTTGAAHDTAFFTDNPIIVGANRNLTFSASAGKLQNGISGQVAAVGWDTSLSALETKLRATANAKGITGI